MRLGREILSPRMRTHCNSIYQYTERFFLFLNRYQTEPSGDHSPFSDPPYHEYNTDGQVGHQHSLQQCARLVERSKEGSKERDGRELEKMLGPKSPQVI